LSSICEIRLLASKLFSFAYFIVASLQLQFNDVDIAFAFFNESPSVFLYAEIESLISKKEQFLSEMESYKKSLIFEYVTGKKEV
jgi:hypothetical protein